jgi:hypothetical protein
LKYPNGDPITDFADAIAAHVDWMRSGGQMERYLIYPRMRVSEGQRGSGPVGWMEWVIIYHYHDNGTLEVHAIQRAPGEEVEFHS